jgi:hypothetical protein
MMICDIRNVVLDARQPEHVWKKEREYKGSDGGKYAEYRIDGDPGLGILTVELDKRNGYRIRNIFVDHPLQRTGLATKIHVDLNAESIKKTGKPLKSSEIGYDRKTSKTTLSDDGQKLWQSFVDHGMASRKKDHFAFNDPASA